MLTCHNRANELGGGMDPSFPSEYNARRRICQCYMVDSRGLPVYEEIDPHHHR